LALATVGRIFKCHLYAFLMVYFDYHFGVAPVRRAKNQLETVQLTIATTATVVSYLRELVSTGLYGKNQADAAERLLAATLEQMVRDGRLKHIAKRT
ncbi:MAG: hypothetical protein JSR78_09435, partial [Proteobacteria bacterium]|nr:hypothetical protein [Pseudomonadota bacterium]